KNNPADAAQDADGDGMTNLQEYLAGTDPQNPNSKLALTVSLTPAGAVRLQFGAIANMGYTVQSRAAADSGSWSNAQTVGPAMSNQVVTITNNPPPSTR